MRQAEKAEEEKAQKDLIRQIEREAARAARQDLVDNPDLAQDKSLAEFEAERRMCSLLDGTRVPMLTLEVGLRSTGRVYPAESGGDGSEARQSGRRRGSGIYPMGRGNNP